MLTRLASASTLLAQVFFQLLPVAIATHSSGLFTWSCVWVLKRRFICRPVCQLNISVGPG